MLARPYRSGPWPGLTPSGAGVLISCAALLGVELLLTGNPCQAWPDLLWLGVTALVPLLIATHVMQMPGAASAVCGAYLLPRSLISLAQPTIELPPLLLVPAIVLDVTWWLRERPTFGKRIRKRAPKPRLTGRRAAVAGLLFGIVIVLVEPPFQVLQRQTPATWDPTSVGLVAALTGLACAAIALLSVRGTAS